MPIYQVELEIPLRIALGLLTGEYKRWGGVIRESASGRIVAHLSEGARIADETGLTSKLLQSALRASSGNATGLLNLAATAWSHRQIMSQLRRLQTLVGLLGAIGVLDLTLSAVSFALMLDRMKKLEKQIEGLYEHVSREHRYDREAKLFAAIAAAEHTNEMAQTENRKSQARYAINALIEARPHIWRDVIALYGSAPSPQNNLLMLGNLLQTMRLDTMLINSYLAIDELAMAKRYLETQMADIEQATRWLVHRCLGDRRAAFFHHESVPDDDLYRYIAIEQWLRGRDDVLLELVLANRLDFWNKDILEHGKGTKEKKKSLGRLSFFKAADGDDDAPFQGTALNQAELLIENLDRLRGFQAEIEAIARLGISADEWKSEIDSALDAAGINLEEYDDFVLLVDKAWLDEQPAAS